MAANDLDIVACRALLHASIVDVVLVARGAVVSAGGVQRLVLEFEVGIVRASHNAPVRKGVGDVAVGTAVLASLGVGRTHLSPDVVVHAIVEAVRWIPCAN